MIGVVKIIFLSLGSAIFLFLLTKMMGNKQISQMNMFDYIIGISIGSIAADMATGLDENPIKHLVAMFMYALLALSLSVATDKSSYFRKIITGRTILLYSNEVFYRDNFKKARMDINDFLSMMRVKGFFDISQIETVLLEPNGNLSILPKSEFRPSTPNDLNVCPPAEKTITNVIIDGHILQKNLQIAGQTEAWLRNQLKTQKCTDLEKIFLATVDYNNNLSVYKKSEEEKDPNPFD